MTVSLAIALITIADVALLAGLAYVMSRASKLQPHLSSDGASAPETVHPVPRVVPSPRRRVSALLLAR